jgi:NADH:ubiquinone oxidoreductase subunit 6 (subunit J)
MIFTLIAQTGITNPVISSALGTDPDKAANGTIFASYFITVWRAIIVVGGLAVLFNLINGAIEWVTSGGEQSKVQKARQKMTQAVIGMVILAGSFIVVNFISNLFGFNLLKFTLPTPQ